ncbi:gamma-glutamyltransferase 5a [Brachionichthys hirsutus]|uniref:gamma-glutamyltransferase 5a n=1 Tax=Brachionichthys hirsutus TaxID=412623 RepID=UPI0036053CA9
MVIIIHARACACYAATLLICVVALTAWLAVLVRCPKGSFHRGAVAADTGTCSRIGRDALQRGGSAVDGAIAALLCTSILNPQSMGIGGGSIFTIMDSSGQVKIISSRETVPRRVKPGLLKACPKTFQLMSGSEWIGVPGELRGYQEAHRLYGRLPWATLFQPTIQLARDGIPVPYILGRYIPDSDTNQTQPLKKLFSDENGNLLKTGDIVRFEKLADTLEIIAEEGPDAFYTGRIAEDLIRDIQEAGGTLTMQDLADGHASVMEAWSVPLGDYQMYFPPPPAGGVLLGFILSILKGFDLNPAALRGEQKIQTFHRYVEALKFANGFTKHIRDPKFHPQEMIEKLKEERFAGHIRSLILNRTHDSQYYNVTPLVDGVGTTHTSVLAEDGSAVSVTSSINHIFGSKVFSPRTGVILNNQLSDFCMRADDITTGERPPSSMLPTVMTSPSKTLVIGASGAGMITTAVASTIVNNIWFGKSLKESIDAPVVYVDSQNLVAFEPDFDEDIILGLKALGHQHKSVHIFRNVVNAVEKTGGCICAVSDPRKRGEAAGY